MAEHKARQTGNETPPLDLSFGRTTKEMSRAALAISILVFLVVALGYFGVKNTVGSYDKRIEKAARAAEAAEAAAKAALSELEQIGDRVDRVESGFDRFANLPRIVREQLILDMTNELYRKAEFLQGQLEDAERKKKLDEVRRILETMRKKNVE